MWPKSILEMAHILLTANDSGLIGGMIFGIIFFLIASFGSVVLITEFVRKKNLENRAKYFFAIPFILFLTGVSVYLTLLEYNLRYHCHYVDGTTINYCKSSKNKTGIEFEYYINGKRYTNCNRHNPLPEIKVPGGKFKVRVTKFAPDVGRIDFEQPLTSDSRRKQ